MKINLATLLLASSVPAATAFSTAPQTYSRSAVTALSAARAAPADDIVFSNKVQRLFDEAPKSVQYDIAIKLEFPGALSYDQLESRVTKKLATKGYTPENTLLATSLCCDELARNLEKDFAKIYGKNFNLGRTGRFPLRW